MTVVGGAGVATIFFPHACLRLGSRAGDGGGKGRMFVVLWRGDLDHGVKPAMTFMGEAPHFVI